MRLEGVVWTQNETGDWVMERKCDPREVFGPILDPSEVSGPKLDLREGYGPK